MPLRKGFPQKIIPYDLGMMGCVSRKGNNPILVSEGIWILDFFGISVLCLTYRHPGPPGPQTLPSHNSSGGTWGNFTPQGGV